MFRYLLTLLTLCSCLSGYAQEKSVPNFVLIFIDDMGYGDIAPFGSEKNKTPHLDQMAREGMALTSFYAAPVCSASRAQLLTGSYAPRVSVPGVFFPASPKGLHPDEITIADYLQGAGYATACFGKWHLGDQREFLPTRQGFNTYFGIPYSNDMARVSSETGKSVHPLMRNEEPQELIENEVQRRITREYTEETIRFIEEHQDEPFFVYLPHTAMHVPLFPHPDFVGSSENGKYGDWVAEVDWSVGQVLDTLRRLGLDKNTLVWFTSDNGPWASKGKDGGESGPLRGAKGGTFEGGVRVPTIAWWPNQIEANTKTDAIAGTTDLLPTFAGLAGVKLNETRPIDGKDLTLLLLGESEESPHSVWHYFQGTRLKAIRSGPWKLALAGQSLGMGIGNQPEDIKQPGRLYHLENDLGETTDVSDQNPDVVARLLKLAEPMKADIGDGGKGPGVRPVGSVTNPETLYPTVARKSARRKTGPATPVDWKKTKVGSIIPTDSAPHLAGKPFQIRAHFSGNSPDGVLISHGGLSVGYSLYVKGDSVVFAVRRNQENIVRASVPLPEADSIEVVAPMTLKAGIALQVNDSKKAIQPEARPISSHPQEDLSVGFDSANLVDPETPTTRFSGQLKNIEVTP